MDKSIRAKFYGLAAASLISATLLPTTTVLAASAAVEQAKNACIVGEQSDGYLGVVTGQTASAAIKREIRDINQQRKSAYADLARRNGVTTEVTAALTAEKLIAQARPGQCYRNASGVWVEV